MIIVTVHLKGTKKRTRVLSAISVDVDYTPHPSIHQRDPVEFVTIETERQVIKYHRNTMESISIDNQRWDLGVCTLATPEYVTSVFARMDCYEVSSFQQNNPGFFTVAQINDTRAQIQAQKKGITW